MKILVIPRRKIGDVILMTPLFRALRAGMPDARIDVLVNEYNRAALEGNPDVDRLRLLRGRKFTSVGRMPMALARDLHCLGRLRSERYDAILLGGIGPRVGTVRLARALRPGKIVCALRQATGSTSGLEWLPAEPLEGLHAVEANLALLDPLGLKISTPPAPHITVDPKALAEAQALSDSVGDRPTAIHLSVENSRKRWPHERFLQLIRGLPSKGGEGYVLLHHRGDDRLDLDSFVGELRRASPGLRISARPSGSFHDLVASLALSRAVICHDSAVAHVAAALGKPVLGLYLEENVRAWRPWGVPSVVVAADESADRIPVSEVIQGYRELVDFMDRDGDPAVDRARYAEAGAPGIASSAFHPA